MHLKFCEDLTMKKSAFITGITGQDGSYLCELLIKKGYTVHGLVRRSSNFNTSRIEHLFSDPHKESNLHLHYGDLTDGINLSTLLEKTLPDEIYNLGAQSHVRISFDQSEYTANVVALGTIRLLESIRIYEHRCGKKVKFYQAGSSEMFGSAAPPQSENTPFHPRSPYACAKVFSHYQTINYRESYNIFATNGILFNHESPRRGQTFVTRKITRALGRIKLGLQDKLYLGNLESKRDWGFAGDYVEAMWKMLQIDQPGDFVIATGEAFSVRDFLDEAASNLDMDWKEHVLIDPRYYRPAEVDYLLGDATKAKKILNWEAKMRFKELVKLMVHSDFILAKQEQLIGRSL